MDLLRTATMWSVKDLFMLIVSKYKLGLDDFWLV